MDDVLQLGVKGYLGVVFPYFFWGGGILLLLSNIMGDISFFFL